MTVKLKYGNTNSYFMNGLLFDTDMPGTLNSFFKAIKQNKINPEAIKYVICSHYHPDHMGLVSDLMDLGIKLVIVSSQSEFIHSSDVFLKRQFGEKYRPIDESKCIVISSESSREFLNSIGISGEIVCTESHSKDGIALILDNGESFVGDLEPFQYISGYADNDVLKNDWSLIMQYNPKIIHYGHNIDWIIQK